ncbi:DUF488 family protein [Niallia oryzisoli]|uniref:DUF488 family protein n=1 Tax=Niallia oryzisoli TaxID=1737571 RepID=A0ABZ2C723_9BACI
MAQIFLKRIYEPYEKADGDRILIDRLWPRGISKEAAKLTEWAKDIAPSSELRKWFCHKEELFEEFKIRYLEELRTEKQKSEKVTELCQRSINQTLTLLYAAKDPIHNHARVLWEEMQRRLKQIE